MRGYAGRWEHRGSRCCEIMSQVCQYLDDSLPIPTQIRMTLHLASCGHCRVYVKQVGFVQWTLALLPNQKFSPINQSLLRRWFSALHAQ
jgi:hypothetical protein